MLFYIDRETRKIFKNCPNFLKGSKTVAKNAKISTSKLNLKAQNIYYIKNFETLKYHEFETACLSDNVKKFWATKVAQNDTISLGYLSLKNLNEL